MKGSNEDRFIKPVVVAYYKIDWKLNKKGKLPALLCLYNYFTLLYYGILFAQYEHPNCFCVDLLLIYLIDFLIN